MPDTSLLLTLDELNAQVADFAFGTRNMKRISSDDQDRLKSTVQNGLRQFYYPNVLDPSLSHEWSFLQENFDFYTQTGIGDYTMHGNFGGAIGPLHHDPADLVRLSITKVTVNKILWQRQSNITIMNWPTMYAETPVASGGRTGQRWQIMLWPVPSATYHLHGRMRIHPLAPNGSQEYLYGGPEHSQTIVESCLAAAELKFDGQPGAHAAEFRNRLLASIAMDSNMHSAELIGYNGDGDGRNDSALMRPDGRGFENFSPITMGGVVYSG